MWHEPEWPDDDRARALAFQDWEDSFDHDTGVPLTAAYDPDQAFLVHETINHARRQIERIKRQKREQAERANGGKLPEGWDDGRRYRAEAVETPLEVRKAAEQAAERRRRRRSRRVTDGD